MPPPETRHKGAVSRPLRAEIWLIDLNPTRGREQQGVRPCLIVSTDALNRSDFDTVVVCPITTTERPKFRWRPALIAADLRIVDARWEARPSWVQTDQIVTVDKQQRAIRQVASVADAAKMRAVDDWLRKLLLPTG